MGRLTNSNRTILKVITIATFVTVAGSCGTSHQMHTGKTNSAKLQDSLLVDGDGNRYYIKIFLDGNLWMTTNLKP